MPRLRNDRFAREGARGDTLASMLPANTLVNDVHSGLNATNVCGIHQPISIDALREVILVCYSEGLNCGQAPIDIPTVLRVANAVEAHGTEATVMKAVF
jgi:hypothetical protein